MTLFEFNIFVDQYMILHPNAENPKNWLFVLGINDIVSFIKNANGRELIFISENEDVLDGGHIAYKEN